ncbi:hypothetical protein NST58_06545 [Paenibacillus sp. FSL R10-2796]|uniref:BC1872 family protein n=1 Tax=Paenibacillus sp. FSL R10-2796 TaxID=2954663 RepID=UPI0030DB0FEE
MTLTREEILAMEPGRKLDALIEEHIFNVDLSGFQWARVGNSMFKNTDGSVTWIDISRYSEDISAAWIVVEKMRNLGFNLNLYVHQSGYSIVYPSTASGLAFEEVMCKTTPDAICKVALLAVLNL